MKKTVIGVLLLVVIMCQSVTATATSAGAITHVKHENLSQYFAKGQALYKAHKYTESMITLKKSC